MSIQRYIESINYYVKVNIDELKLQYAIIKAMSGYGTSFSESEFKDFLSYYESEIKKEKPTFSIYKIPTNCKVPNGYAQYFDIDNKGPSNDPIYKLNNNLKTSSFQHLYLNSLELVFLHTKVNRKDITKAQRIIKKYLMEKAEVKKAGEPQAISEDEKGIAAAFAIRIVSQMKDYYITKRVDIARRCRRKTEEDLIYCVEDLSLLQIPQPINEAFKSLYDTLCQRIENLYHENNRAIISSDANDFLARLNYDTIFEGHTELANEVFGKTLKIDFGKLKLEIVGEQKNLEPNVMPKISDAKTRKRVL